jgi:hypothetical protein
MVLDGVLAARFCAALLGVTLYDPRLPKPGLAEGGRFCESWFWRAEGIPELFPPGWLNVAERSPPGLLKVAALLPVTGVFPGRFDPFPVNDPRVLMLFAGALFMRAGVKELTFMVRTGICEAAAAGAVRAMTERACTDAGGVAR